MLKATELMIGDILNLSDDPNEIIPCRVVELYTYELMILRPNESTYDIVGYDMVFPIPLAAKIFKDNEFVEIKNSPFAITYHWTTGGVPNFYDVDVVVCMDDKNQWRWDCLHFNIHYYRGDVKMLVQQYVHELQHILRDCKLFDLANNFKIRLLTKRISFAKKK